MIDDDGEPVGTRDGTGEVARLIVLLLTAEAERVCEEEEDEKGGALEDDSL